MKHRLAAVLGLRDVAALHAAESTLLRRRLARVRVLLALALVVALLAE